MLDLGLRPTPSGLDMNYYRKLADTDPNIALAGLRIEVEILARNLAKGFKISFDDRDTVRVLLQKLLLKGNLTEEQYQLSQKILQICNAAVHGLSMSRDDANAVIGVAQTLADQYVDWLSWGFESEWKPDTPTDQ